MNTSRKRQPGSLSNLERWLGQWALDEQQAPSRLRRHLTMLVVAAMLDNVRDSLGNHRFVVKGGSALELRFGNRARTSKDLDTIYRGALDEAAHVVDVAVGKGWQGFSGRIVEIEVIEIPGVRVRPIRFKVKLSYLRKPFATLPMEVAVQEGGALDEIDSVAVRSLGPLGLPTPTEVSCLSVRYQIAQKLHACTDPLDGERLNDRAHDLADLILLAELVDEAGLPAVRAACIDIFDGRNRQTWPPEVHVPEHWARLWTAIVAENDFPVQSLHDATARVRELISRIDT